MTFEEFVEKAKMALKLRPKPLCDFEIQSNKKEHWVWIYDAQKEIGSKLVHYEFQYIKRRNHLEVDLHFEGTTEQNDAFTNLYILNLAEAFNWKRQGGKSQSIRYKEKFNMDEPGLVNKALDALEYLEKNFGDTVRKIMKETMERKAENTPLITPKNQILYGPPGTGKTYNTINRALEIIGVDISNMDRKAQKIEFDKRVKEEQIMFTTFHQSMSYEDFIEGIKPTKPLPTDTFMKYEVEPGIFYKIVNLAHSSYENSQKGNQTKLSFEDAFEQLKLDLEKEPEMKFPLKSEGYDFTILGFTNTSIQFKKASGGISHTLSINTLKELYYGKEINFKAGVGIYYPPVLAKIQSYKSSEEAELKNFVLIIDEINRGNVSQIFGELITLIEDSKRIGQPEELQVTLPYSQDKFGVPDNLYIIGTMNTADRSVEALDAALRRRFSFVEMPPQPELLNSLEALRRFWIKTEGAYGETEKSYDQYEKGVRELLGIEFKNKDAYMKFGNGESYFKKDSFEKNIPQFITFNGLDIEKLLRTINLRIEKLLDKDHQIGHSYFIDVFSWADLKDAFQNKIIPLLQEYFFGDYGKIGLVLGTRFFEDAGNTEVKFKDFYDYNTSGLEDRKVYKLKNLSNVELKDFKSIINDIL